MLKIKNKHHIDFPFIIEGFAPKHELSFVPVTDDDDDLTQAIAQDDEVHDNKWVLSERPDPQELEAFWDNAVKEAAADPDWTFQSDN